MDRAFGARPRYRRPSINITPLIDVMFLLLIFFMVSSTFRETLGVDITLPQAATAVDQERGKHEIVVDAEGRYFLGAGMTPLSPAELREQLRGLLAEDPEVSLVLRADQGASFQPVLTAIDIARDVGGTRLVIPTQPLAEAPGSAQRGPGVQTVR